MPVQPVGRRSDTRSRLEIALAWFLACCGTLDGCPISLKHGVMYGFLTRTEAEDMLADKPSGTIILRIGSARPGGLVLSLLSDGAYAHVDVESASDAAVLALLVPNVAKVYCRDGVLLPVKNFVGLCFAEGCVATPDRDWVPDLGHDAEKQ